MPDPVADPTDQPVADPAVEAEPTTDWQAKATEYQNRFAGSQRKVTEEMQARKAAEDELAQLRTWKAEKEQADMTEVERLNAQLQAARAEAAAARNLAERNALAARFPQSFATLGDAMPTNEDVLTSLEARLSAPAAASDDDTEPEPRIDPNNPRKPIGAPAPVGGDQADAWWSSLRQAAGAVE